MTVGREPVSQIRLFQDWLTETRGLSFDGYEALWRWSASDLDAFWSAIWDFNQVQSEGGYETVLADDRMPGAVWFKGAKVNYARQVFRHAKAANAAGQPAIVAEDETGDRQVLTWAQLQRQVASFALTLRDMGVAPGDRVAAYLSNRPEAIIAFLACASVGATWSLCAPDMGPNAVAGRFTQIGPKVLIATDGVLYAGKSMDRAGIVAGLLSELPTVEKLIVLESGHGAGGLNPDMTFAAAAGRTGPQVDGFEAVWLDFDHPLWIVYSSGTTGLPKPIVHGHGGVMMTGLTVYLNMDLGKSYEANTLGERYHWYSSTGWVMWNSQVGGLLMGSTICIYDGSPSGSKDAPDWGVLFRFAARNKVTFLGVGAAFWGNAMKAGVKVSACGDLSAVRALGSTGSPLPEDVQRWGTAQFAAFGRPDIWWCNIAGGTDLCGVFCGGARDLPQIPGEIQCRQLGAAVEAWNDAGEPVVGEVGELVCTRPIPGMPLYFWGDEGNARLLSSYFDVYPGVWRHGDWLKITREGGCIIYGRSDATINRHGLRMGTSEIYAAVECLPEVLDSMAIDLEFLGRESWLGLFVVLREGMRLDDELKGRINMSIRAALSPRFLPDAIIEAPAIPRTLSGKKQEVPVKKMFLGQPAEKIINLEAMANPECVAWYVARAAEHTAHSGIK